jgi:transcriptional regulator with XRE-family HTH domain
MADSRHSTRAELIAARRNRGLSQRAAAERIGVNRGVYERAERGLGVRPANQLLIAQFFGFQRVTDIWPVEEVTTA